MTLVVVTGASRGIGRATALAFARRGCTLALLGRPSLTLAATQAELGRIGVQTHVMACELAEPSSLHAAATSVLEQLGAPECVVNNAGIARRAPLLELELAELEAHLAVNFRAPVLLSQSFLPAMLARGTGRFIHVGSISSTVGSAGQIAYNASKWALLGFAKCLAEELRDTGLSSVAVLPGSVDTDMLAGSAYPPRMSADDVARTIVHYALDAPIAHNGAAIEMFGV